MRKFKNTIKHLKDAQNKLQERIAEIDTILNARPFVDIINLRKKAQKIIDANRDINPIPENVAKELHKLAEKEKQLFKLAEKQKNSVALIDEKIKLEFEIGDIDSEIYSLKRRSGIRDDA